MRRAALTLALLLGACAAPMASTSAAAPGLVLDAEGLRPAGSALRVDFGRAEDGAIAAVSRLLGAGPVETAANAECGAGPVKAVRWANGLTLNFQRGAFLGWVSETGRGTAAAASTGLGPGTARAALQGARFEETSLGTEFEAGGVFGLVEGGEVRLIWAGVTCFFR
ncbi:MAG: hypothetical protein OEM24_02590 [Paracoccaceae bacterium]|nr:hypothetical protein [Paracoccaceae bacterium]